MREHLVHIVRYKLKMKQIHKIILAILAGLAIIGLVTAYELVTVYNPFTGKQDYISTDLVSDTTPQLGGYLDANGQNIGATDDEIENIYVGTNTRIYYGDGQEFSTYYNGTTLITG